MKKAQDYLDEANAVVRKLPAEEAIAKHKSGEGVFIDVRDGIGIAQTGTIDGALRLPRGMIEFYADDTHPLHNEALKKDAEIYLVCGAGGQAALTGKTLVDMGFTNVTNIGGIGDWKEADGPMEEG